MPKKEIKEVNVQTLVKYDNILNELNFTKFTTVELDFFMCVLSAVAEQGTTTVKIPMCEIKEITNSTYHGEQFRKQLEKMNMKLLGLNANMVLPDGRTTQFVLFPTFITDEDVLEVDVNPRYCFLINELAQQFTQFKLREFVGLKSKYSKNLYRLLKQFDSPDSGWLKITVDDLRQRLDIPRSYKNRDVMEKAIKPALKELLPLFPKLKVEVNRASRPGAPVRNYEFRWKPFANEEIEGQISFSTTKEFDELTQATKKKNKFHNFEQRQYDQSIFEALERKALED